MSKFTLNLYGGSKGLLQNNTNICRSGHTARIRLKGQNGRLARQ